jgi:hypothetical protein
MRIDNISGDDYYTLFGQNCTNMHLPILHLRIPLTFTTPMGAVYTGEECFLMYLYHVIKVYLEGILVAYQKQICYSSIMDTLHFSIKFQVLAWNNGFQWISIFVGSLLMII